MVVVDAGPDDNLITTYVAAAIEWPRFEPAIRCSRWRAFPRRLYVQAGVQRQLIKALGQPRIVPPQLGHVPDEHRVDWAGDLHEGILSTEAIAAYRLHHRFGFDAAQSPGRTVV